MTRLRGALFMLLLSALACGAGLLVGAFFLPIGPEGVTPRDLQVQQISDIFMAAGVLLFLPGLFLLLTALTDRWLQRFRDN